MHITKLIICLCRAECVYGGVAEYAYGGVAECAYGGVAAKYDSLKSILDFFAREHALF